MMSYPGVRFGVNVIKSDEYKQLSLMPSSIYESFFNMLAS